MSRIKGRDTKPEMLVRKMLFAMGYRYRLHAKDLPGKPDIVFRSRKKAVFVHGCFWHQHDSQKCPLVAKPASNLAYWDEKLAKNTARDKKNIRALKSQGWKILVVWECDIKKNKDRLPFILQKFMEL